MIEIKFRVLTAFFHRDGGFSARPIYGERLTLPRVFKCGTTQEVMTAYKDARRLAQCYSPPTANKGLWLTPIPQGHNSAIWTRLSAVIERRACVEGLKVVAKSNKDFTKAQSPWEISDFINKFGLPDTPTLVWVLRQGLPIYSWDLNCRVMLHRSKPVLLERSFYPKQVLPLPDGNLVQLFTTFSGEHIDNEYCDTATDTVLLGRATPHHATGEVKQH